MPPTRRARTSGGGPANKGAQSTLTFASSKPTQPTSSSKDVALPLSTPTIAITTPSTGHVSSEAAVAQQARAEVASLKAEQSPEQIQASKITDAQIRRYWTAREGERRAARVHQEGLGVEEKVLRLWDMSSQFGVCSIYLSI